MTHLGNRGSSAREELTNQRARALTEAHETGADPEYVTNWKWPHKGGLKEALGKLSLGK